MSIALACRVCKSPVIVKGPADIWTADITPHRNRNVRHGDLINRLAVLALFHIYPVKLLHEPHSVLIDLRFCLCPGRIEVKLVSRQMFSERFCDLAAARVVNTDKGDFLFTHGWTSSLCIRAITWTACKILDGGFRSLSGWQLSAMRLVSQTEHVPMYLLKKRQRIGSLPFVCYQKVYSCAAKLHKCWAFTVFHFIPTLKCKVDSRWFRVDFPADYVFFGMNLHGLYVLSWESIVILLSRDKTEILSKDKIQA